jgi:gluconokinase
MERDEPLTDEDRRPWLERVRDLAAEVSTRGADAVVTCSCLKRAYRDLVRGTGAPGTTGDAGDDLRFLHLAIDPETAAQRVGGRRGHFFDESLVASQFAALEPPRRAVTLDASRPVEELVDQAILRLGLGMPSAGAEPSGRS